jgi:hypothetical protein
MVKRAMRPTAVLAGLVTALAFCGGARGQDGAWAPRRLPWYGLPGRVLVGSAPASLPMPADPGACGAVSGRLEPFAARGAVFLRVALRAESGAVSIALRGPDGVSVLSKQKTITPADGVVSVFFRVDPGDGPRAIMLCQANPAGGDSRADVESLNAAFVGVLPADEAAKASVGLL